MLGLRERLRRGLSAVGADEDTPEDTAAPAPATLTVGEICDLLSSARRRAALRLLLARDDGDGVPLGELTDAIAAHEADVDDPDAVGDQQRKRVYVSLYQCHLPALADAGVVETGRDNIIHTTPETVRVHEALTTLTASAAGDPAAPAPARAVGGEV